MKPSVNTNDVPGFSADRAEWIDKVIGRHLSQIARVGREPGDPFRADRPARFGASEEVFRAVLTALAGLDALEFELHQLDSTGPANKARLASAQLAAKNSHRALVARYQCMAAVEVMELLHVTAIFATQTAQHKPALTEEPSHPLPAKAVASAVHPEEAKPASTSTNLFSAYAAYAAFVLAAGLHCLSILGAVSSQ